MALPFEFTPLYVSLLSLNCWSDHRVCPLVVVFLVFVFPVFLLLLVRWLLCRISVGCLHWVLQLAFWGGILCRLGTSSCLAFGVFPAGVPFALRARYFCFPLSSFWWEDWCCCFLCRYVSGIFFLSLLFFISLLFLQFLSGRLFCPGLLSYFETCFSSKKRSIAGFSL